VKVHLSNYDYIRNFDVFLRGFDPSNASRLDITTNDKWINVHPAVLAAVAALGLTVKPENITFDDITAKSGHYLDRMGLFRILGKKSPFEISAHESAGRFVPIAQIKTPSEQTAFITEIVPLLHLPPEKATVIQYTLGELIRNVLEHASASNGAIVAAQYYREKANKLIRLGICDTGIGIKQSMARVWPYKTKTDLDAIMWALVPGVSGTTVREGGTGENAGAGLFFVKSISLVTRDYFALYSGTGLYKLLKRRPDVKSIKLNPNPAKDRHTETNEAPSFPGTLIAIDISLDEIDQFSEVLDYIRTAYKAAVKERKKLRYRPQFID
jgi:anti-sigma regulatory factor (Ser/Thr protein kinase)